MYNINNQAAIKMESYIDNRNTNYLVKVTDLVDNDGWYANSPDTIFIVLIVVKLKIILSRTLVLL
jgi:hypothetical protein